MADNNINISGKDIESDDRIAKFLRGEMTAEEEKALTDAIAKDGELRSKAVAMAHLVKATKAVGRERDELVKDALLSSSKGQVEKIVKGQATPARLVTTSRRMAHLSELKRLITKVEQGMEMAYTIKRLMFLWEESTMPYYNAYTSYAPLIGWNLAIANLKNNDRSAAKGVLTQLASGRYGDAMAEKAKELLEKLK